MSRTDYSGSDILVPNGLRGYRFWTSFNGRLVALHHKYSWQPGLNYSTCSMGSKMDSLTGEKQSHKFHPNCTCGFYARYLPEDLLDLVTNVYSTVVGAIEATGIVAHGDRGFRAEKARVLAICPVTTLMHPTRKTLPTIADYYRVPLFRDMDELVHHFRPDNISNFVYPYSTEHSQRIRDANLIAQKIEFNSDVPDSHNPYLMDFFFTSPKAAPNTSTNSTTTININPKDSGA